MLNKAERAKLAKETINKTIPELLQHNVRAQKGVQDARLVRFPTTRVQPLSSGSTSTDINPTSSTSNTPIKPVVRVVKSDTFDAARTVLSLIPPNLLSKSKICVLNMASSLHPGGGVVRGALAQEESLCMRSTLYHSLDPSWYRLPDLSCIYTPSVLVFRDSSLQDLKSADRFYVDVISVAALKNPDCMWIKRTDGRPDEYGYSYAEDQDIMLAKMRGLFQTAKENGVTHLILGALGCGAYGNPPKEVARMFKRVIEGGRKHGPIEGFTEIVFAIFDEGENLNEFRGAFPEDD